MAMLDTPSHLTLGLDIGIGSLGWCLLDKGQGKIVDGGVHLWDPPQEPKTKVSLAVGRRTARSSRRRLDRAKIRRKRCLNLLKEFELVPENADSSWLQSGKGDAPIVDLRKAGLDRLLTNREFAQVLYSLNGHRGYIPHGEAISGGTDSDDKENGKVLSAITENRKALKEGGWRTVGEMLADTGRARNRGGDYQLCASIDMLVDEAKTLISAQESLGNPAAGSTLSDRFTEIMRWEKKTLAYDDRVYETVGFCTYFPTEHRAATASLSFEMCRAFEQLGQCIVIHEYGQESPLPADIRQWAMETLFSPTSIRGNKDCKVTYGMIRKKMDLPSTARFKGVATDGEGDKISDPKCWAYLRRTLTTDLMNALRKDRIMADSVCEALTYASSIESLANRIEGVHLKEAWIEEIMTLPYSKKLFKGYGRRSLKALNLLIDQFEDFEDVLTLSQAEQAAGLFEKRIDRPQRGSKLPPYTTFDPTCKNPVVLRSASRVRHVVNAIIAKHGVPNEIHIELGRELKHSAKEKAAIEKANRANAAKAKALRSQASEFIDLEKIHGKLLSKLLLWDEQGGRDVYTDEPMDFERMLKDPEYCEIDHILPLSRTCDDSRTNKVLALHKSNQDKGQKTPFEWLSRNDRWETFAQRISMDKKLSPKKKERLLETNLDATLEGKFISRNLNDTRYASRSMMNFIEQYIEFPDDGAKNHVIAVSGGATGALRHAWGLRKSRSEDACHHFLDAAVIAACDRSAVQAVAKAASEKRLYDKPERGRLFSRTQPWGDFREEVEAFKEQLIPTRMIDHKLSGRIFEDSRYRFKGIDKESRKGILEKSGSESIGANFIVLEDGKTALKPDGQAFLRLWWDPEAKVRGRAKPGRYLAEVVYYADLAAIRTKTYTPRYIPPASNPCHRNLWPEVPERAMATEPLVIFRNDLLCIKGKLVRYISYHISNDSWCKLVDPKTGNESTGYGTLASIDHPDDLRVIEEDLLGECFASLHRGSEG